MKYSIFILVCTLQFEALNFVKMKTSFTTVTSLYLFISLTGIAGEKVPPMVPPAHYETAVRI